MTAACFLDNASNGAKSRKSTKVVERPASCRFEMEIPLSMGKY